MPWSYKPGGDIIIPWGGKVIHHGRIGSEQAGHSSSTPPPIANFPFRINISRAFAQKCGDAELDVRTVVPVIYALVFEREQPRGWFCLKMQIRFYL